LIAGRDTFDEVGVNRQEEWDREYESGVWDYLAEDGESARYSIIAGYVLRFVRFGSVLDLGCGEGRLLDALSLCWQGQYTGVDVSRAAIDRISVPQREITSVRADLEEYSPTSVYDAIVFNEVLYYVASPVQVVRRYFQYLSPTGIVIVSMYRPPLLHAWSTVVQGIWSGIDALPTHTVDAIVLRNAAVNRTWEIRVLGHANRVLRNTSR
jgi:SAM-dependent methyltransferase